VDAGRRLVVVGSLAETAVGAVHVEDLTFHRPSPGGDLSVQLRSSSPAVPVRSVELAGGRAVIALGEAAYGVAPGQTAVLYSGTQVAMAGTIAGTET
jgi:tRNA-specific 2-thiouridylase